MLLKLCFYLKKSASWRKCAIEECVHFMFKKRKYVQGLFSNPRIMEEAGVMFNFIFFVEIIKKNTFKRVKSHIVLVFCWFFGTAKWKWKSSFCKYAFLRELFLQEVYMELSYFKIYFMVPISRNSSFSIFKTIYEIHQNTFTGECRLSCYCYGQQEKKSLSSLKRSFYILCLPRDRWFHNPVFSLEEDDDHDTRRNLATEYPSHRYLCEGSKRSTCKMLFLLQTLWIWRQNNWNLKNVKFKI